MKVPPSVGAAIALGIQILVAVCLFALISGAAILLNWVTNLCESRDLVPGLVVQGMHALEFFLWAADVVCFVLLIVAEIRNFFNAVWNGERS